MKHRGYTILELIVSVGVFSVVMLAATGALLALINLDRQARATSDVVTNLTFAVDSMAREIRTGTGYMCNNSSSSPNCTLTAGTSFGFTDNASRAVVYSVSSNQIVATINGVSSPITDSRVRIDRLNFYVRGVGTTGADLDLTPQVVFVVKGTLLMPNNKSIDFSVQSSASQRKLELAP